MIMRGRHADVTSGTPNADAQAGAASPSRQTAETEELAAVPEELATMPDVRTSTDGGLDSLDDPFDEDLEAQLRSLGPKRIANRFTAVLAAAALLTGGFVAGAQVQRRYGSSSTPASTAGRTARGNYPGGAFPTGGARFGASGAPGDGNAAGQSRGAGTTAGNATTGNVTTGKVKLVDGTTVYLETSDGRTITVKTNGSTTVQTAQAGSLADLTAGATVTVEGTGSGTSITATKVTRTP